MATVMNTLYELAQDLQACVEIEYDKYLDHEDVQKLPVEENRFITIGSLGMLPQNSSDQLAVYIGAPFPGFAQQGDSTVSLSPTSVMMAVDLTRCYPQPSVSRSNGRIIDKKFHEELARATKTQSNDLLIIRDATKAFYDTYGAGEGIVDNIQVAIGQDNSGALIHLTATVNVLLARKAREILVRN